HYSQIRLRAGPILVDATPHRQQYYYKHQRLTVEQYCIRLGAPRQQRREDGQVARGGGTAAGAGKTISMSPPQSTLLSASVIDSSGSTCWRALAWGSGWWSGRVDPRTSRDENGHAGDTFCVEASTVLDRRGLRTSRRRKV